jgi:lipid-A-disaccharide synthase-like uncharacterized protein
MAETLHAWWSALAARDLIWLSIGLIGQAMFSARWIVQWLASEKSGRSIMPEVFWYLSFLGGLLVLSYGIHKLDPVIILGQFGVLIYARNLFFIRAGRQIDSDAKGTASL